MVNSLLILFVHNRPKVLQACMATLFANAGMLFDKVIIINDASEPELSAGIFDVCLRRPDFDLIHFGTNIGYGNAARVAFDRIERINPKYVFWMEQDYVWRKNWAAEAVAVLEANPTTLGVPGYSHPDYYDPVKVNQIYPEVLIKEFGADNLPRSQMFKPFETKTSLGNILVQGVSNGCGTSIWNWHRIKELRSLFNEIDRKIIQESCAPNGNSRLFGDGTFTHGLAYYFYCWHDFSEGFPWLDICDYSLGNHISGGEESINAFHIPEMTTHVGSPKWKNGYMNVNPRQ